MILESSRDVSTGLILLIFEGDTPTQQQIDDYTYAHHGVTGKADIEPTSECKGLKNPGTIRVTPTHYAY